MSPKHRTPTPSAEASATEERHLMGPRHLQELLDQVSALDGIGSVADRAALTDVWRASQQVYGQLALSEAGAADSPDIRALPRTMARHIERLVELPGVQSTFDTVPVAFGLVELDKLVISQYSMTQAVVDRIRVANPLPLGPKRLAELCLPLNPPPARFRLAGRSAREFTFVADAHDMRFLDAQVLQPTDVLQAPVMGHAQAVVALSVGFSANLLNAVRYNGRIALNNGHHRALALRGMGFTHAPCLIQPCASMVDLEQAATREICQHADLYFDAPRPPLLRDFDNPLLTHTVRSPRMQRVVTLRVDVQRRLLSL